MRAYSNRLISLPRSGSFALAGLFFAFVLLALPVFSPSAYALDNTDNAGASGAAAAAVDDQSVLGDGRDVALVPDSDDSFEGGQPVADSPSAADAAASFASEAAANNNAQTAEGALDAGANIEGSASGTSGVDASSGSTGASKADTSTTGNNAADAKADTSSDTAATQPADNGTAAAKTSSAESEAVNSAHANASTSAAKAASSGSASSGAYTKVAEGVYSIVSALGKTLDVSGGGTANSTNVQIYQTNYTPAQRFYIQAAGQNKKGEWYYTIKGVGSGKVIDVDGAGTKNGTNVQIYQSNSTAAQQWYLRAFKGSDGKTYYRIINVGSNKALDVAGAEKKNGTNVWIYQQNQTAAQDWTLRLWSNVISEGAYKLESKLDRNYVVEIKGNSGDDSAQAQINKSGASLGQSFALNYSKSTGYYTITSYGSGKMIDVDGAGTANGTKIQQYGSNGTFAQWWQPVKNSDGSYTFYSALCGSVLDVDSAKVASGTRIHLYEKNGTNAQRFFLTGTSPVFTGGTVRIQNGSNTYLVADVKDGSTKAGAALQLYASNGTRAQKYYISKNGDGTYAVREIKSGMYVTALGSGSVVQKGSDASADQAWYITATTNGHFALVSKSGLRLGASSAVKQGNALNAGASAKGTSWNFVYTPIISNGLYVFASDANSSLVLDVAGASISNAANVQLYSANGTNAQKFYITHLGSNVYSLRNLWSGLAVDVKDGAGKAGANVQQYEWNNTNAQKWRAYWQSDGSIVFKSQLGEFALNAATAKSAGNVNLSKYATGENQRFHLAETTAAKASMSDIISALDQMHASGLTVFKSVKGLSSGTLNQLKRAINNYKNAGISFGFVMVDLKTGATVAYNSDRQIYSASTIKGPYVASLLQYNPGSLNQSRNAMHNAISWSSNEDYASLRYRYGSGALQNLSSQTHAGIDCTSNYIPISAMQLAKLWAGMANYFDGNSTGAKWCKSEFSSNYYINARRAVSGTVYAKSGWLSGGSYSAHNEACIVDNNGSPYIMSVVSNHGVYTTNVDNDPYMTAVMKALDRAHSELVSGL